MTAEVTKPMRQFVAVLHRNAIIGVSPTWYESKLIAGTSGQLWERIAETTR